MSNKKVLITGGAGFIGSNTTLELLRSENYELTLIDNFCNSNPQVIKDLKEITNKSFEFYNIDLCDEVKLESVFKKNTFDAVIHFAGLKAVGESVQNPLLYYKNNLISTLNLLQMMQKYACQKIVFSSSATVYHLEASLPFQEDSALGPSNPYGQTKLMIECMLKDFVRTNGSAISLRYFNPVGADPETKKFKDSPKVPNNIMPYLIKVASNELSEFTIFGSDYDTSDGTAKRDYIHVKDLAKGHALALKYENKGFEVFNLGTGKATSVLELLNCFQECLGKEIKIKHGPRRPGDIPVSFADASKAEKLLGFKARLSLEDMCKDSL